MNEGGQYGAVRRAIETAVGGFGIHSRRASIEMKRETREALPLSWNTGLLLARRYNTHYNRRGRLRRLGRDWNSGTQTHELEIVANNGHVTRNCSPPSPPSYSRVPY